MCLPLTQERTSNTIKHTHKHITGKMTMKWLLVLCVYSSALLFDYGRCDTDLAATELSYNERYNEIVKPSFIETINKQLPKEGKFFDDFDCKHARTDGLNVGCERACV